MSHVYVASPYTHDDPEVMEGRYEVVLNYIHKSFEQEPHHTLYSPIVYYHQFAKAFSLPRDAEFWRSRNEDIISSCKEVRILMLEGWKDSFGINQLEIPYARSIGKPITFIEL